MILYENHEALWEISAGTFKEKSEMIRHSLERSTKLEQSREAGKHEIHNRTSVMSSPR